MPSWGRQGGCAGSVVSARMVKNACVRRGDDVAPPRPKCRLQVATLTFATDRAVYVVKVAKMPMPCMEPLTRTVIGKVA